MMKLHYAAMICFFCIASINGMQQPGEKRPGSELSAHKKRARIGECPMQDINNAPGSKAMYEYDGIDEVPCSVERLILDFIMFYKE